MPDTVNPYSDFDEAPAPAPGPADAPRTEVVQGRPMSTVGALPQPTEADQAEAARGARESAGRTPRQRAQPQQPSTTPAKPVAEGASVYDQFDGDPKDDGVALMERLRLNRQDAYYRGTLAGSAGLAALAHIYRTPDPPDISPERKAVNKQQREEYLRIVADLAAHDQMEPWGTTLEAGVALGGQLSGMVFSPESWVGWGAKGVTVLGRAARTGVQQAGIQAATDPAIQGLNISADVQKDFDPLRPFIAAAAGFGIGTGGHLAGEGVAKIVGQAQARKILFDLGREDPSFDAPRHAMWALDPNNGIQAPAVDRPGMPEMDVVRPQMPPAADVAPESAAAAPAAAQEPRAEAAPEAGAPGAEAAPAPEKPRYEPGPEHGFEDFVKAEKTRLSKSYGAAQSKASRLNDEARFSAFDKEAGGILQGKIEEHQLDPDSVRYGDIWKFYEREPGQAPEEALESAIGKWVTAEERRALQSVADDAQLQRDLDEWARAYDAEMERMSGYDQTVDVSSQMPSRFGGRGSTDRTLPGVSAIFRDYRPAHLPAEEDIPFEYSRPDAPKGGDLPAGGDAQSRQARGADGAGAEPSVRGERGGGGPSADGAQAAAPTDRGEKLGPAAETFGGKPLATERTAQGEQTVMPGAERESPETIAARQRAWDKEEAEARMRGRKSSGAPQESADDLALFGGERQKDLLGRVIPEDGDLQAIAQRRKGGKMDGEPERVPVERGEPASPEQDVAIRSLQQQAMDLAKALDFPLRQGRVGSRGMAGTFNPRSGVVRVLEVPDFDVVSHEAGHAIESKIGPDLTALTQANAGELRPLDYDQTKQRVNEGFAEYVRLMMTNPAYARARAPGFDTQFRQFMSAREPEMLAKIDAAAAAYKAYLDAPSVDAVGSVRRSVDDDPKGIAKVVEHVRADGLPTVVKSVIQKSYDAILDDKAPIARTVRELGIAIRERTGQLVDLKAGDNPEVLMRLLARSRQAAVRDLMDGVRPHHEIDPVGPAFADGLTSMIGKKSVWGKWDPVAKADAATYVIARRAELLWRKFEAGEIPNPPVAFSRADAQMAMADLEAQYPNFRSGSDMIHEYTRQLLKKSFDGGLIDADLYAKLSAEEFYVPFMRDMSDRPGTGSGMGQGGEGPGTTQIIKRLRGSSRDIKDPFESIMAQTFMVNRTLRHNDVIKAFVDLAKRAGPEGGKYVEPIPAHEAQKYVADLEQAITNRAKDIGMDPDEATNIIAALGDPEGGPIQGSYFKMEQAAARGEPIVFYREGGQLRAARFMAKEEGHGLYELLTAAPEPVTELWIQIMASVASVQRAGIVTNPAFALANYVRDQLAASILRSDYIPIVGGIRGISDEFRQAQNAVLYGYAGGVSGGASTGPVDRAFENEVNALAKKGYLVNRVTSFKGALELASFTEAGTRNSIFGTVFEASKRKGLSDYEAMVEAAFQAQDLIDFSRHGSRTMAIRNILPFLNAYMQGMDKARRTFFDPILREIPAFGGKGKVFEKDTAEFNNALAAWAKAGGAGAALGAAWAAINADSNMYQDASPYFKGTHLVIPWGNQMIVMPKPFELGMGFTAGEYAYHMLAQKDPTAAAKFVEAVMHTVLPPDPITGIPGIKAAFGIGTNKSMMGWGWLTGESRDIVPEALQGRPSPQQYSDRTSDLAKWLGKETGMSPMKIEYGVGELFGLWGRDVMALSQGVSEDSPAASMSEAVLFRRFVKDPTRSSNVITKFWDYMSRTTGRFNQDVKGYDDMVREAMIRGTPMTAANEFLAKLPAAERAFVTLKSGARDDGKPAFTPDERRLHPLQNAYDAVGMLNTLRKELATNSQITFGGREKVNLNPQQRRLLLDNVRELSQMTMYNALVIMGEPGYATRQALDPNDTMDKIRHISPVIAHEIATRYATAKVYSVDAVRKAWPQLRDRLVRNGTNADILEMSFEARADGYQFNGTREKRPGVIRRPIAGQSTPAP